MTGRVAWVDVGKGLSILGVLLFHVVFFSASADTVAARVSAHLDEVRMSLFFLVSGMFAHKLASMTAGEVFRRRVWAWAAPYVTWGAVSYVLLGWYGVRDPAHGYITYLVFPENGMWFLYALVVYTVAGFAAARLRVPPPVVLWASAVAAVAGPLIAPFGDNWGVMRVLMFAPYFFGGLHARRMLLRLAQARPPVLLVAAFVAGAVAVPGIAAKRALMATLLPPDTPGLDPRMEAWKLAMALNVGYVSCLAVAVLGAVALSMIPVVSQVLTFFGRRTLALYLSNEVLAMTWLSRVEPQWLPAGVRDWLIAHQEARMWILLVVLVACGLLVHAVSTIPVVGAVVIPRPLPPLSQVPPSSDVEASNISSNANGSVSGATLRSGA